MSEMEVLEEVSGNKWHWGLPEKPDLCKTKTGMGGWVCLGRPVVLRRYVQSLTGQLPGTQDCLSTADKYPHRKPERHFAKGVVSDRAICKRFPPFFSLIKQTLVMNRWEREREKGVR